MSSAYTFKDFLWGGEGNKVVHRLSYICVHSVPKLILLCRRKVLRESISDQFFNYSKIHLKSKLWTTRCVDVMDD
jgi:hypothetical protein